MGRGKERDCCCIMFLVRRLLLLLLVRPLECVNFSSFSQLSLPFPPLRRQPGGLSPFPTRILRPGDRASGQEGGERSRARSIEGGDLDTEKYAKSLEDLSLPQQLRGSEFHCFRKLGKRGKERKGGNLVAITSRRGSWNCTPTHRCTGKEEEGDRCELRRRREERTCMVVVGSEGGRRRHCIKL